MEPPSTAPDAKHAPPLLELAGVTKSYGAVTALGPLTIQVPGGCVAILGPNGAGKSTLLRLLLGLTAPQSGTVRVMGDLVRAGDRFTRQRIGYAPEGDAIFPGLSGAEAVAYAGRLAGMPRTDAIQRSHQILDYVGIEELRYRQASTYSSGMRQRLKLAQALVHDPETLILDEPTEAVDPESRKDLLRLIRDLHRNQGVHILISTHLLSDAEAVADSAIVLHRGQLVAQGPLTSLKAVHQPGYEVRVNRDPQLLQEALLAGGIQSRIDRATLTVHGVETPQILACAQAAGLVVRHLAPLEMSLQDAFRQAVAGGTRLD